MSSFFITFEGIEGSGKSTQAKKLQQFLTSKGVATVLTSEPGGTETGKKIREMLVHQNEKRMLPESELLLNFVSRIEHVNQLIAPALARNQTVISDRYLDSTYAYQGYGFSVELKKIDQLLELFKEKIALPDLTFLIDLPVELAFARIKNRASNNSYEQLDLEFHQRVREGYLMIARNNPRIIILDGRGSEQEIAKGIAATFDKLSR